MDAKLQSVMLDYGLEGYGLYWYCIELIAQRVNGDNLTFELEHDARIIARNTGSTPQKVEQMMTTFINLGLLNADNGHVFCLKLASRCDDFTAKAVRRKGIKTIKNQSVGESPILSDKVHLEEEVRSKKKEEDKSKDIEQSALLETGFNIFYSAGLVKKSKVQAFKKFKALVKQMNADPIEFGNLVAIDVKNRIAKQQFGIDKLHPSTYLNNQRWDDEHETNNGNGAPSGRQSAAERIAARNAAKYGQPSSGLGLAAGGGDLRGAVDEGEWRDSFPHVDPCPEQIEYVDCEEWDSSDHN